MVALFVFFTVLCGGLAVYESLQRRRRELEERLMGLKTDGLARVQPLERPKERQGLRWLRSTIVSFRPARSLMKRLDEELSRADILLRAEEFLLLVAGVGFLCGGTIYALTQRGDAGFVGAILGTVFPFVLLRRAQARRLQAFNAQIADALVVMANTLRAGFGFLQAMEVVRREMPPPISKEFGQTLAEMNLGIATEEALMNLARRIRSEDLELVITAVVIQRAVGGNLASILDTIAGTIRERVRIKGEIRALTAQGRISGLVIGLLPVGLVLLLFFISPGYLSSLWSTPTGVMLAGLAVGAEILGALLIKKIVDIKV